MDFPPTSSALSAEMLPCPLYQNQGGNRQTNSINRCSKVPFVVTDRHARSIFTLDNLTAKFLAVKHEHVNKQTQAQ